MTWGFNDRNKCPHPKCEKTKDRVTYACREHWFSLPESVRQKISHGYNKSSRMWVLGDKEAIAFWNQKPAGPEQMSFL